MVKVQYKQKCVKCKKNYVLSYGGQQSYVICYDCQKEALQGKIKDPVYAELLNVPEEYYQKNGFLRNIKIFYLKNKSLSVTQAEAFKKVVEKMKEDK